MPWSKSFNKIITLNLQLIHALQRVRTNMENQINYTKSVCIIITPQYRETGFAMLKIFLRAYRRNSELDPKDQNINNSQTLTLKVKAKISNAILYPYDN